MLDHVSIEVSDRKAARDFYDAVMPTLGLAAVVDHGESFAYGLSRDMPCFWLIEQREKARAHGFHVTFRAPDEAALRAFYRTALRHGGQDDGDGGYRAGTDGGRMAFILDPDGNRIEVVCYKSATWSAG